MTRHRHEARRQREGYPPYEGPRQQTRWQQSRGQLEAHRPCEECRPCEERRGRHQHLTQANPPSAQYRPNGPTYHGARPRRGQGAQDGPLHGARRSPL